MSAKTGNRPARETTATSSAQDCVDPVDSSDSPSSEPRNSGTNAGGTELVPPAQQSVDSVDSTDSAADLAASSDSESPYDENGRLWGKDKGPYEYLES